MSTTSRPRSRADVGALLDERLVTDQHATHALDV